jgi:hypothetical protein
VTQLKNLDETLDHWAGLWYHRYVTTCLGVCEERPQQGPFQLGYTLGDSAHVSCQPLYCTLHDPQKSQERLSTALLLRCIEGHHLCDVGIS